MGVEWKWKLDFYLFIFYLFIYFFGGNICVFMLWVVLWFVLRLVLQFVRECTVLKVNC